jgi:hypothetical protein
MDASLPPRHAILRVLRPLAAGLAVAALGGFVFNIAGFPAAWIAGSTVFVAAATLCGLQVAMPPALRDVVFVFLGISMGAGVTPDTLHRLPDWPLSLVMLAVTVGAIICATYAFFRHMIGWDWQTALFASVPGALSYVLAVAVETEADMRKVAIAQSIRLITLVVVLPVAISSVAPASPPAAPAGILSVLDFLLLLVVGGAAGLAAHFARVPAGLLTGAFLASAILHGTGLVTANLPPWLLDPCFVTVGVLIGSRFQGTDLALLRDALGASLGGFAVGIAVSLLGTVVVVVATEIGWGQVALAYAPGGLEAMIALAFALAVDPAFVAAHQLARFILIAVTMPAVLIAFERVNRPPAGSAPDTSDR